MRQKVFQQYQSLVAFLPLLLIKFLEPVVHATSFESSSGGTRLEAEAKANLSCRTSTTLKKSSMSKVASEMSCSVPVSCGGHGLLLVASLASLHDRVELSAREAMIYLYRRCWNQRDTYSSAWVTLVRSILAAQIFDLRKLCFLTSPEERVAMTEMMDGGFCIGRTARKLKSIFLDNSNKSVYLKEDKNALNLIYPI